MKKNLALVALSAATLVHAAETFTPVFTIEGVKVRPESFTELPAFTNYVPIYSMRGEVDGLRLTPFAKSFDYPKKYVRRLPAKKRRATPYRFEDVFASPRATVDSDYARSGKPFFLYERVSRPPFFLPSDGCPLADRASYAEWLKTHTGFIDVKSLGELDSDSNYFERFYDKMEDDSISAELHGIFGPPDAKGRAHRVRWARKAYQMACDFHFGEKRMSMMCSNNPGYEHIFGALGARMLWYEATTQSSGSWNLAAACLRGAARQRGLDYAWYMAQYYTGFNRKGENLKGDSRWFTGGVKPPMPHRGESRSMHRRQTLLGWLIGAKYIQTEGWTSLYWASRDEAGVPSPSDYARDFNEIYELGQKIDRGESYTPLAILTPLAEPTGTMPKLGNRQMLEPDVQATIFETLEPQVGDSGAGRNNRRKGEQGCMFNSEFPCFYDTLCPDAGQESAVFAKALTRYRHVLIAGNAFDTNAFDRAALAAYAKQGGQVHRYPSDECPTPEALRSLLRAIRNETMPVSVEGDIQWGVNKTKDGWLVYLINNKGVIKFCDEPEEFDLTRTAHVTVTVLTTGEKLTADVKPGDFKLFEVKDHPLAGPEKELRRYWRAITGTSAEPPVTLAIDASVSSSGNDAYAIRSTAKGAAIVGSNLRSVYYGVYDLLERRGGCGWFWDGDVVPHKDAIDLKGLNVREESKFAYRGLRYFAHRGLTRFQAEQWGPTEWKRELDWLLKTRQNLFMLRIGQDDFFQRAFPDVCAYPDAAKPLPGALKNFDNRSLFWSLEYRGKLRKRVMDYAFAHGLMAPEDFGTMTHWYSRTPQDFLDKMKPDALPQAKGAYGEPSGLVWDIRQPKWMDAYWRITDVAVREYGRADLLHTIGIAERRITKDRNENRRLKAEWTNMILSEAKRRYPESRRLLAGWDFYCMQKSEEVRAFLKNIPEDVIIWDYEADAYKQTNFTEWDVIGKRPYVFGVFMAYEAGLDPRTQYAKIAERQKLIANDPMCKGYILWPESSHVDSLGIAWYARQAWDAKGGSVQDVAADYCARRYPAEAKAMRDLWLKTIAISTNNQEVWRSNACLPIMRELPAHLIGKKDAWRWEVRGAAFFRELPTVVAGLTALDWEKDEMLQRDMTDLARVWADRLANEAENLMMTAWTRWCEGDKSAAQDVRKYGELVEKRLQILSRLLDLHTDYSLCDALDRLNAIERVANPDFGHILVDNAANGYCASHQAEALREIYLPAFRWYLDKMLASLDAGKTSLPNSKEYRAHIDQLKAKDLDAMRTTTLRTRENFNRVLADLLASMR